MTTIHEITERVLAAHPHWQQEKARWIALQIMGTLPNQANQRK